MTEANPFAKGQLRREAADWFLKMREPGAEAHRADFEAWLARGAMHRSAYNSIAQTYLIAQSVDWDRIPAPRPVRGTMVRTRFALAASLMVVAFIGWRLVSGVPLPFARGDRLGEPTPAARAQMQVATRLGEIRRIRLPDGSQLTLDTDTLVTVDLRGNERDLRIEHGRARFEVAHELRPFIVTAGQSEVVAHGTVFDVSVIEAEEVDVHLLSGSVEVRRQRHSLGTRPPQAVLRPGEEVQVARSDGRLIRSTRDQEDASRWPAGLTEFRGASLTDVVEAANRYSALKIRLASPDVAQLRVSGVLRLNEPDKLAASLAQLFALRVARSGNELVLMQR